MTISANTVFEVQSGGADTNGGGFVAGSGGTDYTQQTNAQQSWDGSTNILSTSGAGSTTLTSNKALFTSAMVGNIIQITGGTNFQTGFYQIVTVTDTSNVVLDRTPSSGAAGSAGVGAVGGALASPGKAAGAMVGGNIMYIKYSASVYAITSASTNISNGCVSLPAGVANGNPTRMIGYDTNRTLWNSDANKPTLQLQGTTSATIVQGNTNEVFLVNLIGDANSTTNGGCFGGNSSGWSCYWCKAYNTAGTGTGFRLSAGNGQCYWCLVSGCTTGYASASCFHCVAINCTSQGYITGTGNNIWVDCIATGCAAGFQFNGSIFVSAIRCLAYGSTGNGFTMPGSGNTGIWRMINCRSENNGGYGYGIGANESNWVLINCSGWNNTSGNVDPHIDTNNVLGFITVTSDPNNNAAGNDFSLNNISDGGALLRNIPDYGGATLASGFPGLSTPNYQDIGPVQHQINLASTFSG